MGAGSGLVFRWLRWLLLVTALFAAAHIFSPQLHSLASGFRIFTHNVRTLPELRRVQNDVNNFVTARKQVFASTPSKLQGYSRLELARQLQRVKSQIDDARKRTSIIDWTHPLPTGDAIVRAMEGNIELVILEQEQAVITDLLNRKTLWQDQFDASERCERARNERNTYLRNASPLIYLPLSPENRHFNQLDTTWNTRCKDYAAKRAKYIARSSTRSELSSLENALNEVMQPLELKIEQLEEDWYSKIWNGLVWAFPRALAALVLIPISLFFIRAAFYWLAQFASNRQATKLLPDCDGSIEVTVTRAGPTADSFSISGVSQVFVVDEEHEMLVHPEFLQSMSHRGIKETKWLLDWTRPIRSLATGMVAVTRIRATPTESFVISDKTDPLGEIGVITLPVGSAFTLQPRKLVGLILPRNHPLRTTRHYRFGTLAAWLTLQFRYLVFHGPVTLIIKGRRGIRVEKAGRGRSIDQAATIGFSANLAYSIARCETFGAYLTGKHGLFDDRFSDGPGFYVYEQTPHFGKAAGVTGRGLEGIIDAVSNYLSMR